MRAEQTHYNKTEKDIGDIMKYLLEGNKDKNEIMVTVNGKELMKICLSSFINEADKFLNDQQDDIFAKSINKYSPYGHAIQFQRDFKDDNNLLIFVYCGLLSGAADSTVSGLKAFVEKYR